MSSLLENERYFEFSRKLLNEALKRGTLIINEIEDITELTLKIFPCSLILKDKKEFI